MSWLSASFGSLKGGPVYLRTFRNPAYTNGMWSGEALQPDGSWKPFTVCLDNYFTIDYPYDYRSGDPVSGTATREVVADTTVVTKEIKPAH